MAPRALIFGDSGGIGSAISAKLMARGYSVLGLSRSKTGFDITDPASVNSVMAGLNERFELVVVATGILAPEGQKPEKSLGMIDADAMAQMMAVNATGPALVLRHMPKLLPHDRRSVVAVLTARVGSIGDNNLGGWYAYRASKAAANQIVRTAAIEIRRQRKQSIIVALHPGTVDTEFTKGYPGHKKLPAPVAAEHLLQVMDGLTSEQNGGFFDWAGKTVPW